MKRLIDILGAGLGLVLLAPVLVVVALCVRLKLGRPVLFRQPRVGRDEKIFNLIKFRTMREATDAAGRPLPDAERLTRFGRLLRATSLDELPELWNILKGDMSLVGPRPLLVEYLPHYTPQERRRHAVRPGLTGLAQVRGRNALSWRHKFRYDVFYVDHASVAFDLRIMIWTVAAILRRDGISAPGEATMQRLDNERSGR
ncbi:sugar transferase [Chelatococcus sp. SYSU_G07232]|uniref:Sugar transferase n=1 Tax=Chelatococcus albus TaxID=3047466 RepID=A0ABT7AFP8_9HYPH|nr:sugar transferase [Chelatococcus sp. SYSU_G07232]MDJ1158187.1 sugar transferase [Chelatococcus sp. SYSU_G07232]